MRKVILAGLIFFTVGCGGSDTHTATDTSTTETNGSLNSPPGGASGSETSSGIDTSFADTTTLGTGSGR